MTKSAYDRAREILKELRSCILKYSFKSTEKDTNNKKFNGLRDELDEICREIPIEFFRYEHIGMGHSLYSDEPLSINTLEDAGGMWADYDIEHEIHYDFMPPMGSAALHVENNLIPQARKWLDANKKKLSTATFPKNTALIQNGMVEPPASDAEAGVPTYRWKFDGEKCEVRCNGNGPVKLQPRLFKLFVYLHKNPKATIKALQKNFKAKGGYERSVQNNLDKLISALDKKHEILKLKKGEIKNVIKKVKNGRELEKVIFHRH